MQEIDYPTGKDAPEVHLERLAELAFGLSGLRTCLGHLLLRTESIDAKIRLTEDIYRSQQALSDTRERISELLIPNAELSFRSSKIPTILDETVKGLTQSLSFGRMGEYLLDFVRALQSRCGPISDGPSLAMLKRVEAFLHQIAQGAHGEANELELINVAEQPKHFDDWWKELNWPSIPQHPARDQGMLVVQRGEYIRNPEDLLADLHGKIFNIEISAAEICAMTLVRFNNLPDGLERTLARQCWDEGRHANAILYCFRNEGGKVGAYPVHFHVWDAAFQGKTPEEVLGIEQVIGEGFKLGNELLEIERYRKNGQVTMARVFEHIYLDEIQHVRKGLSWFRLLAGDQAESLLIDLESRFPNQSPAEFDVEVRRYVGFSENEIDRQLALHRNTSSKP